MPFTLNASGWYNAVPSADSRIMYVSSSGNDGSALIYSPSSPEVGADPRNPVGPINAHLTVAAAVSKLRKGFPDWVLFKKGDVWRDQRIDLENRKGRSEQERFVIWSYGAGSTRPKFEVCTGNARGECGGAFGFCAVMGIELYAYNRDPLHPNFTGGTNKGTGFHFFQNNFSATDDFRDIHLEDCKIHFYDHNVHIKASSNKNWGGPGNRHVTNIVIRRNVITDAYRSTANAQGGLFNGIDGLIFDDNVMDHNGWYANRDDGGPLTSGWSDDLSQNVYITAHVPNSSEAIDNTRDERPFLKFRNNIMARASASGIQQRRGGVFNDNLLWQCPFPYMAGGPGSSYDQYVSTGVYADCKRNVIIESPRINSSNPGGGDIRGRNLAEYIIQENLMLDTAAGMNTGTAIQRLAGTSTHPSRNIDLIGNICYNRRQGAPTIGLAPGNVVTIRTEENNIYWDAAATGWPVTGTNKNGESVTFPDPTRNLGKYNQFLGGPDDELDFLNEARQQSRDNWRTQYTALAANAWIRAGFQASGSFIKNGDGWHDATPSPDSRIMYVDPSGAGGQVYTANAAAIGPDPKNPVTTPNAYTSLSSAMAQMRDQFPDWVLIRRGKTLTPPTNIQTAKRGRSEIERMVITSYRLPGDPITRPILVNPIGNNILFMGGTSSWTQGFWFISSLHLWAKFRDPSTAEWTASGNNSSCNGIRWLHGTNYLTIEDCRFDFQSDPIVIQGDTNAGDPNRQQRHVHINRCQIFDAYGRAGIDDSSGLFITNIEEDHLVTECIFDHNGWYGSRFSGGPSDPSPNKDLTLAYATIFNHNIYNQYKFAQPNQTKFLRNITCRGSLHGCMLRTGGEQINNLSLWNAVGLWQNTDVSSFQRVTGGKIEDNVVMYSTDTSVNPADPTQGAKAAQGVYNQGSQSCSIRRNIIAHDQDLNVANTGALLLADAQGVILEDNIVYNWAPKGYPFNQSPSTIATEERNHWDSRGNYPITGTNKNSASVNYFDPSRTPEKYMQHVLGGGPYTIDDFFAKLREDRHRLNWDEAWTAPVINDWIRAGFQESSSPAPSVVLISTATAL